MIVSTKTIDELMDLIKNRMVQHQAQINRLEYSDLDSDELQWHKACMCELRYMLNIIELRYC